MNDIINPNLGAPEPKRPSNEEIKQMIQHQVAQQESNETVDKIIHGEEQKVSEEQALRHHQQAEVAVKIVLRQLNADAQMLEESAKQPGVTVQECHQKMDTSRSLRMSMSWLQGLLASAPHQEKQPSLKIVQEDQPKPE